jgi:ATP-binding cassette subfamily C protein
VGVLTLLAGVEVFHLPAPVLITLLIVLSRISALAATIQHGVQQIVHSLPANKAILELESDLVPPTEDPSGATSPPPSLNQEEALAFVNVDYGHEPSGDRRAQLHQASLVIRAGTFVGLVGPSGVGKTTFLDLAAGVLRAQSGEIYAFGQRLCGQALNRHREQLAYVAQDSFLFDDSVRANLAWSAPARSEADMLEALQAVGAERLLDRLAQGLDTRIGNRGAFLSAGERQRIALACALLRRPRLLLLDEATNAIDVAGEELILRSIAALSRHTTILMVAHRLESLRLCNEILEFPALAFRSPA